MCADAHDELLEIVDEQNIVVATALRRDVHKRGLLHRAVYCWVFDPAGQVLVQRRASNKRIGPLLWDISVAEHLEPGESYAGAAKRGIREELGIEADELVGPLALPWRRGYEVCECCAPGAPASVSSLHTMPGCQRDVCAVASTHLLPRDTMHILAMAC